MDTNHPDPVDDSTTRDRTAHDAAQPEFVGHPGIDEHDHQIGTVVDVAYDDSSSGAGAVSESPTWLVVDPGMLRAAHWLPVAGTYRSASGSIVVPWDRDIIKHSPKATDDHRMTPALERQLTEHYELASFE